ncbi:hypothetical protein [Fulvivirga kasyanovii]|uniref:Uncharacterized protein n=1 Tax=Fulvivirga kasyanovii TaxID=396812 RepID=A0ABW9RMI1_9BACT|nr:hypothetical protein [Fulvivirga kasyanovii]MTI25146.1 hypothetical protein [Fulvivirga kasyanovii]
MKKKNFKLDTIKVSSFVTSIEGWDIRGGKSEVDPTSQSKPITTICPSDEGTKPLVCYHQSLLENCDGSIK